MHGRGTYFLVLRRRERGFADDDDDGDAMSICRSPCRRLRRFVRASMVTARPGLLLARDAKAGIIIGRRRIIAPRKSLLSSRGDGVRGANAVLPVVFGTLTLEGLRRPSKRCLILRISPCFRFGSR